MGKYIVFDSYNQQFALPIEVTDKILLFEKPTKVPDTAPYLLGLLPYEGEILPVIDVRCRLFQEQIQPDGHTKIISVLWKGAKLGLAVENVTTVLDFDSHAVKEPVDEEEATNYIREMFRTEEGIVMHLDVEHLLSPEGEEEIKILLEK